MHCTPGKPDGTADKGFRAVLIEPRRHQEDTLDCSSGAVRMRMDTFHRTAKRAFEGIVWVR